MEPRACILRLTSVPPSPPPGFEAVPVRKGLSLPVPGPIRADPERIKTLEAALPKGAVALAPFVRLDPGSPLEGALVLVLPIRRSD